jgi:hypothetical protein
MFWSKPQQHEDIRDQMTTLIGSAIQLFCGDVGFFVIANEAFDPQSNAEYILYRLDETILPPLLAHVQGL